MLLFALKRRRFYMSVSDQEFSSTAGLMLDGEEPPSTTFCIPQSSTGEVKLSFAGDIIGGFLVLPMHGEVCVHACVCIRACVCVCISVMCVWVRMCVCVCMRVHVGFC